MPRTQHLGKQIAQAADQRRLVLLIGAAVRTRAVDEVGQVAWYHPEARRLGEIGTNHSALPTSDLPTKQVDIVSAGSQPLTRGSPHIPCARNEHSCHALRYRVEAGRTTGLWDEQKRGCTIVPFPERPMSSPVPLWTRDTHRPTDRAASVFLVCFSQGPLRDDILLDPQRFGVPAEEAVALVNVRRQERNQDPKTFDGWRTGAFRTAGARDLGDSLSLLDAADECQLIRVGVSDRADLGYLQVCWALARWMCARGAGVVLDGHAGRFWKGSTIANLPPNAPFDIDREISIVLENEPSFGEQGHFIHTRGMVKMARPDVVSVCAPEDSAVVAELLKQLALGMAQGLVPKTPRHSVRFAESLSVALGTPPDDIDIPRLRLNNDAVLVSYEDGGHLIGLAARMHAIATD